MDQVNEFHKPVVIFGKKDSAILVSEEDWNTIQETLYLTSIPRMRESIIEGMKEPLGKSLKNLDW
ncbi:MAG: type II toxin-antitoxin system Phd/YefM family antitoxin [Spirochaetia bacterium]|nr:type II toxin-antitoxin system Phd/YefM family antitoxin [Spirochaetia bacterium]